MAYLFANLVVDACTRIGCLRSSAATSTGSTTTIVDSKMATGRDDVWKNGLLVITYDAVGAGAAPEGDVRQVSAFASATGTFTVDAAWSGSASTATSDQFAFTTPEYGYYDILNIANQALKALGDVVNVDTTTLDTTAAQSEYAYAVTWKRKPPIRVSIQGKTGDTNDNQWVDVHNWKYIPAAPGTAGLIVFDRQYVASRDIRVMYYGAHAALSSGTSVISEYIAPELAIAVTVEKALEWNVTRSRGAEEFMVERLRDAKQQVLQAKADFPIWKPKRSPKILTLNRADVEENFATPS